MTDIARVVDAVWRIEGARIVATLAKVVGDLGLAEDLAQEAVADALAQWQESGVPRNAGAWLTAVAKRKAIDGWRRRERLDDRYRAIAHDLEHAAVDEWEPIDDDVLRLVFTACHPVLGREAQVALTLRVVGGLTTEEIARLFFVPVATVQQRIVRAKKTLTAARVPFEVPDPAKWPSRLGAVLGVVYLMFTEGYAATSGDRWIRADLAHEALRIGRVLAGLMPREPEVHGLVALMELQASRFAARIARDGSPVLLADQDRSRWDHAQIARGRGALERADALGRGRGNYALQAAIAEQHAIAPSVESTGWGRIVVLYEALGRIAPNPVVELTGPSPCRWRRVRHPLCSSSTVSPRTAVCAARTCCRACAGNCSHGSVASRRRARSSRPPRDSSRTRASGRCCWRRPPHSERRRKGRFRYGPRCARSYSTSGCLAGPAG